MNITNICYIDGRKTRIYPNDQYTLNIDHVFKNFEFEIPVTKKELNKLEKKIRKEEGASDYVEFCVIYKLKAIIDDDTLNREAVDVFYEYISQHLKRFFVIRKIRYNEPIPLHCENFMFDGEDEIDEDGDTPLTPTASGIDEEALKINFV